MSLYLSSKFYIALSNVIDVDIGSQCEGEIATKNGYDRQAAQDEEWFGLQGRFNRPPYGYFFLFGCLF